MKYAALIFDMDGTIVDTEHIWIEATRQLVVNQGVEYSEEVHTYVRSTVQGMATHEVCFFIKQAFSLPADVQNLIQEKTTIANKLYQRELRYIDGFENFLAQVKQAYTKDIAIATNATDTTIQFTDKALNLKQHFGTHIYGIEEVDFLAKPDPAIYLYAADKLGVDPRQCIAIEDSAHGINAAKSAGMYCIGINSSGNIDQLRNADRIIQGYHELVVEDLF